MEFTEKNDSDFSSQATKNFTDSSAEDAEEFRDSVRNVIEVANENAANDANSANLREYPLSQNESMHSTGYTKIDITRVIEFLSKKQDF